MPAGENFKKSPQDALPIRMDLVILRIGGGCVC